MARALWVKTLTLAANKSQVEANRFDFVNYHCAGGSRNLAGMESLILYG